MYDRNTYKFHKAKYYSVTLGNMAWINGRAHNDGVEEAVVPVETVTKIGLEGVACDMAANNGVRVRNCRV
jgi:hypothetical protein